MNAAVVVAAGTGSRLGRDEGKQTLIVAGQPLVTHALRAFEASPAIAEIVLVAHPDRVDEYRAAAVEGPAIAKVVAVVPGGETRQDSVAAGLGATSPSATIVAVHDGARPLVTADTITTAVGVLEDDASVDGVVVGHRAVDTMKTVEDDGLITATPDRSTLWSAQTPQVFRATVLREAYASAQEDGFVGTDDAALVSRLGGRVVMLEGPRDNIKVTVPEDVAFVEWVLERRAAREG